MNSEQKRALASIHLGILFLSEQLYALADATESEHQKRHLLAAARALNGIDERRAPVEYLKALAWTLEQVAIELEDALSEED
jgi:hypothetical protein